MDKYGLQGFDEQTKEKIHELANLYPKISIPKETLSTFNKVSKLVAEHRAIIQTANLISCTALKKLSDLRIGFSASKVVVEQMATVLSEIKKEMFQSLQEIKVPTISKQTRNRIKFMKIAARINFPIYFEIDTELQTRVLDIYNSYIGESEDEMLDDIKRCIVEYYNHDMLDQIMYTWFRQPWIKETRKDALREAVEVYEEGRFYLTGSTLMCQLGGLITELYDITKTNEVLSKEDKKEILSYYNINKIDSEKSKIVQMMLMQSNGALLWYNSAKYFVNFTYSSSNDMSIFDEDPGRNKICHGVQTNYGKKEIALKAILVIDIVVQLGIQMLDGKEKAS